MAAIIARVLRSSLLEIPRSDYVKLARAKGASETCTVMKHALRNAMIPTITVLGLQVGVLLGGNMIVEAVFGWPGLGRLVVDAIFNRDFPHVTTLFPTRRGDVRAVDAVKGWPWRTRMCSRARPGRGCRASR